MIRPEQYTTAEGLIERLRLDYAATLDRLLPQDSQIALLDYPSHRNIGDHLIWLGETAYLGSRQDLSVRLIGDRFSYSHRSLKRHLSQEAIILLHGGGNFGDIYPPAQRMREAIIEQFPNHRFIQLPQTVSFGDPAAIKGTAAVLQRHPDFTLLARDEKSFELVQEFMPCKSELCVDAAFMLGAQPRTAQVDRSIIWISRTDRERMHDLSYLPADIEIFDWDDVGCDINAWQRLYRSQRAYATGLAALHCNPILRRRLGSRLIRAFDGPSWMHANAGFQHLSRTQVLVTDRLHGHIMAVLLDLPHVLLDNADSKLKRFYDTWTYPAAGAQWADSPEQAFELAQTILQNQTII